MNRQQILETAITIITKDRAAVHGAPEDSFRRIADYWGVWLGRPISTTDVAAMMALMKMARIQGNPGHLDSAVDLAGYIAILGELQGEPEPPVTEVDDENDFVIGDVVVHETYGRGKVEEKRPASVKSGCTIRVRFETSFVNVWCYSSKLSKL